MDKKDGSIVGLLISLFISLGITFLLIKEYPSFERWYNRRKMPEQIAEIAIQTKTYKLWNKDYAELSNSYLVDGELLPKNLIYYAQEENISNKFGGSYVVSGASTDRLGGNKDAFVVSVRDIDKDICKMLTTYDWTKLEGLKFLGLSASLLTVSGDILEIVDGCNGMFNPNGLLYACPNGSEVSVPVPEDKAEQICNCQSGNDCSVILKFE
jgi:hypothetical protein